MYWFDVRCGAKRWSIKYAFADDQTDLFALVTRAILRVPSIPKDDVDGASLVIEMDKRTYDLLKQQARRTPFNQEEPTQLRGIPLRIVAIGDFFVEAA